MSDSFTEQTNNHRSPFRSASVVTESSDDKPEEQVVEFLSNDLYSRAFAEPEREVRSILEPLMIDSYDGELTLSIRNLFCNNKRRRDFQIIAYMAYLSSNNLESERQMDQFLRWMIVSRRGPILAKPLHDQITKRTVFHQQVAA
jgi:hypothetical protein